MAIFMAKLSRWLDGAIPLLWLAHAGRPDVRIAAGAKLSGRG
jgi:hypothetical protein